MATAGTATRTTATYHVLLVGIDDYKTRPLHGCVNDIDAIQRVLLARLGLGAAQICRLASPLPSTPHDTAVPSQPATLANLRAALVALGSEAVRAGDHVLIYYAGHGTRIAVAGQPVPREALAPVDAYRDRGDPRLLFDGELAARLAAIAARTANVTIILDTCSSAGAIRPAIELPGERARFLPVPDDPAWQAPLPAPAELRDHDGDGHGNGPAPGLGRAGGDYHVVTACAAHERAYEAHHRGASHGLLTRALLHALDEAPGELGALTWRQIWDAMRAEIEERHPGQHLWMAGNPGRAVLAGPPLDGNPGLVVIRGAGAEYHIAAGSLAGVTPGAVLALYGDQPRQFPRLDSPDDHAARIGRLLRVTRADRAAAIAEPVEPGAPAFDVPPGARGRLIAAGAPERLRCALVPDHAELAAELSGSPLLEVVEPARAEVQLVLAGGRWFVADDAHGAHGDAPVLIALGPNDLGRARHVLEHYHAYARPLRMAVRATDLPGGLELAVLAAEPAPAGGRWIELAPHAPATYELAPDTRLCVRVRNTSRERLRVTLACAAASGKVQLLGDEVIDASTTHVFNPHGTPFTGAPSGVQRCVDRLIAIGCTALTKDLGYLRLESTFAQILHPVRARPRLDSTAHRTTPPPEQWTAAQVWLETRAGSDSSNRW